jgi:hypothetical protein
MTKGFVKIFLLLIIAGCTVVVLVVLGARGSDDNYFNKNVRHRLSRHEFFRNLFRLHYDGDARSEYLGQSKTQIQIRVGIEDAATVPDSIWQEFAAQVEFVTSKRTAYEVIDNSLVAALPTEKLFTELEPETKEPGTAYVYVAVLGADSANPDTLGKTFKEHGIIFFKEALDSFTSSTPATYTTYAVSTLLHEFGHQIGLPHNNEPACLMNEHAESDGIPKNHPSLTVTNFCAFEEEQIKTIIY